MRRPDAARWPKTGSDALIANPFKQLSDSAKEDAVEIAEMLLEIATDSPELAWVRDQVTYFFATRDPNDTEFHPVGHPREGQPRYGWVDRPDGAKVGWLIDAPQAARTPSRPSSAHTRASWDAAIEAGRDSRSDDD